VPPKRDVAAWRRLRKRLQGLEIDWAVRQEKAAVARRREIERLESLPPHPIRARHVQRLREEAKRG